MRGTLEVQMASKQHSGRNHFQYYSISKFGLYGLQMVSGHRNICILQALAEYLIHARRFNKKGCVSFQFHYSKRERAGLQ